MRESLLRLDFIASLQLLQNAPHSCDVGQLLEEAHAIKLRVEALRNMYVTDICILHLLSDCFIL